MTHIEKANVLVSTTKITVRPENRKEFFQTISSLLEPIRKENGCLEFRFYEESGNENSFVLIGEWQTHNDWHEHIQSNNFAVLLGSTMVLSIRSKVDFKLLTQVTDI